MGCITGCEDGSRGVWDLKDAKWALSYGAVFSKYGVESFVINVPNCRSTGGEYSTRIAAPASLNIPDSLEVSCAMDVWGRSISCPLMPRKCFRGWTSPMIEARADANRKSIDWDDSVIRYFPSWQVRVARCAIYEIDSPLFIKPTGSRI
jgi:hypothetical protein